MVASVWYQMEVEKKKAGRHFSSCFQIEMQALMYVLKACDVGGSCIVGRDHGYVLRSFAVVATMKCVKVRIVVVMLILGTLVICAVIIITTLHVQQNFAAGKMCEVTTGSTVGSQIVTVNLLCFGGWGQYVCGLVILIVLLKSMLAMILVGGGNHDFNVRDIAGLA